MASLTVWSHDHSVCVCVCERERERKKERERERERERAPIYLCSVISSSYKNTDPAKNFILTTSPRPSYPQESHLQIPSHCILGLQHTDLGLREHKHSFCNSSDHPNRGLCELLGAGRRPLAGSLPSKPLSCKLRNWWSWVKWLVHGSVSTPMCYV